MGSRFNGVPLSATQMAPKVVPSNNNSSSPGIRAPVTADDSDFEYSGSSKSRRNSNSSYYSGSSDTESEGFGSGEDDELGTDTEKPYVSDQDEGFVEKSNIVKKNEFRPVEAVKDEEEVTDKLQVPIAMISRDSDEDSQGSEVLEDDDEDDGFSGVARVPSIELPRRVDGESRAKSDAELEFAEDSLIDNVLTRSDGEKGEDRTLMEQDGYVTRALSATPIQDEVFSDESIVSSQFGKNEVQMPMSEPDKNGVTLNLGEEIQESDTHGEHIEQLAFHIDPKAMVVKMEEEHKDLLSFPSEEILRDETEEIDGLVIRELDTRRSMIPPKSTVTASDESKVVLSKGEKKRLDKLQKVRVKYLTLLHRLGFSHEDSVATRVLHHLTVAEARFGSRVLDLVSAEEISMKFKSRTKEDLDYSLSILVIGKTGVGKSASINSIFGETKTSTDAFQPATVRAKEITGTIHGVKVKVFDTPGLRTSSSDQFINKKVLTSIKKTVKKCPPDVVLYVDRLDTNVSYHNDLPLFKAVSSYLGSRIWSKSIVVLTHASSLPLDESDGFPLIHEAIVSKWSRAVHLLISREILQKHSSSMAPVSLVENNPGSGESLSHFGESWRTKLLHFCYSIKTLSEVNSIVSIQNVPTSLPFSLSSLLQSNVVDLKLSNGYSDMEMAKSPHPEQEKCDEYGSISPCKPLTRSRMAAVPLHDIELLPPSFNGDDPSFRYHFMKPLSPHFIARPVLEYHGWDNDCGYDAVLVEYQLDTVDFSTRLSIQLIKEKNELNLQIHSSASEEDVDDGNDEGLTTSSGLESLTLATKKLSYALKVEKKFRNLKKNTTDVGISLAYPIDQNRTSFIGLIFMRYRGEIRYEFELESRFSIDTNSKLNIRAGLNSKRSVWASVNTSSCSNQLQLSAVAFVSIASAIFKKIFP